MEPERHKLGVPARLCLSCPVSLQFGASREFGRRSGPVQPCILLYLKVLGARPFHLTRQCVESCWGGRRASSTPASQRGGLAHHWLAPLGAEGEGGARFQRGTVLNCSAQGGAGPAARVVQALSPTREAAEALSLPHASVMWAALGFGALMCPICQPLGTKCAVRKLEDAGPPCTSSPPGADPLCCGLPGGEKLSALV